METLGGDGQGPGANECMVKGAWLVTTRRVLRDQHGDAGLERVASALGEAYAASFTNPVAALWYPETLLQRILGLVSADVCQGDPARFGVFIEAGTVIGINRFLRVVLSLSSPAYVLSKMPTFWGRHRRNNGELAVELEARRARLLYTGFPFFDDPIYRIYLRTIILKTMEIACGERPEVTVRDYTRDSLALDVFFKTMRLR